MLSPSKTVRHKFESIVGDRGNDLLKPKNYEVVKRGALSPPKEKETTPTPKTKVPMQVSRAGEEHEDGSPKRKTMTMTSGAIKFEDIIIPPSAPTDLICEECEVTIAILHCRRCRQVFCMKCAEACHPKSYGSDYHPHEVDGHLRAVEFGDTSRIKITNEFVLPDLAMSEEEYMKYKDLTKPQSLSTSRVPVQQSKSAYSAPKYDVHQVVLFKDPQTEREAYGSIISQWDQRHGTMATPAILRGEGSVVYYMVQMMGFTKHVSNIANLIPPPSTAKRIDNYAIIDGTEVDPLMEARKHAHTLQKRIAEAEAVRKLGPKHHLRDVVNYNHDKEVVLLDNREYGLQSTRAHYQGAPALNSAVYNSNLDDSSECGTAASSTASQRQLIANKHRRLRLGTNNEYVIRPVDYNADLYKDIDLNQYADIDTDLHSQLSLDNPLAQPYPAAHRSYQHYLQAAINRGDSNISVGDFSEVSRNDDQSQATEGSASGTKDSAPQPVRKKLNMGAALKNAGQRTGKFINTGEYDTHNIYQSGDHRVVDGSSQATGQCAQGSVGHEAAVADDYTKRALQILVLKESEMCTVQERIASEVRRKNALMLRVLDKLGGSQKLLMKQHGFSRWKENIRIIRGNVQHRAAIRIQSLGRKYLCRDTLAEKTEEFITRQRRKWEDVHSRFRYSDASDPRAVTMDKKVYFKTHLDLNRYAALLRVLVFKLAKYLARKRMVLLRGAITRWRGSMVTFLESDIQSSHINDLAIDFEPTKPEERFVSVAHQRNKITLQHVILKELATGVVLTSPLRSYPTPLVDDLTSYDTIAAMPLRLPELPPLEELPAVDPSFNQMMTFTHLSRPGSPMARGSSPNGGPCSPSQSTKGGICSPVMTPSVRPQTGGRLPGTREMSGTIPTAENSHFLTMENSAALPESGRPASSTGRSTPVRAMTPIRTDLGADSARLAPLTPLDSAAASVRSDVFGDSSRRPRSGGDQFPSFASSYADPSGMAATGTISNASVDQFPIPHDTVPSYYPAQDITNLPPLPPIYIPRTAQERLHVNNHRRLDYANFRTIMEGPTFDSCWVMPEILCMGSMPWGEAALSNTEYPVFEDSSPRFGSMKMSTKSGKWGTSAVSMKLAGAESAKMMEVSASAKAMNGSTGITDAVLAAKNKFKHQRWKPPPVTAVSALLLNKIDVFVSLMDVEEEAAIERACRVPSVQSCIHNALATANAAVSSIISQATEVIARQNRHIQEIPQYGKTDPRFHDAYRETLRCKARIQLAEDNIAKARKQIKDLPPHAAFVRIPLRIDGLNTVNEILPKIWQIEALLQQNRRIYVYSRDGRGRAGVVTSILLGRLYNLHPYEALYRVQASNDSAKRDSKREIPVTCPQLPVQRELVTQVLNLTNRPQELAFVRTQIDPETFVEHLPQRPVVYDPTVHTSYTPSVDGSVGGGVYRPPHGHPRGVTMVHSLVADPHHDTFRSMVESSHASSCDSSVVEGGAGGGSADDGRTRSRTTVTGRVSGGLSWASYQEMEAAAAEEAAERAKHALLGNNLEVQQAEQEFLQALFAAQNIRKKQALGMAKGGPYTWDRGTGITHRSDPAPHQPTRTELPPEPLLPDLYERNTLGQSVDVARKVPTKRPEPAERPHLPHIRTAATPAPPVPLHHCNVYVPT